MKKFLSVLVFSLFLVACTQSEQIEDVEDITPDPDVPAVTTERVLVPNPRADVDVKDPQELMALAVAPAQQQDLAQTYSQAILKTNRGDIAVELFGELSPITVNNFLNLAQAGYYDGVGFHRVIPEFMIQGGDPNSADNNFADDGTGGPGYMFEDEFNDEPLVEGSLAMANAGPNTNGSQFFIVTAPSTPWLDGMHTNFGRVTDGMDVVKEIESTPTTPTDQPVDPVIIESVELVE
jgi:cyclophilin family peptidyl-prolyl cis-trans isomerase